GSPRMRCGRWPRRAPFPLSGWGSAEEVRPRSGEAESGDGVAVDVKVPDIGDFKDVPVIEVLVKPGDQIAAEAPLITLESDKASMEVPSPAAGVVREVAVKVGDKVSEGSLIARLDAKEKESRSGARP